MKVVVVKWAVLFGCLSFLKASGEAQIPETEDGDEGHCPLVFNAIKFKKDEAPPLNFYYTSKDQNTVEDCARFCSERHFCRTAQFNPILKTCAISYTQTVNCYEHIQRFVKYTVKPGTRNNTVYRIACVNSCSSPLNSNPHSKEKTDNIFIGGGNIPTTKDEVKLLSKFRKGIKAIYGNNGDTVRIRKTIVPKPIKVEEKVREINHLNGSVTRQVKVTEVEEKLEIGELLTTAKLNPNKNKVESFEGLITYANKGKETATEPLSKESSERILKKGQQLRQFKVIGNDAPLPIQRTPLLHEKKVKNWPTKEDPTVNLPFEPIVINGRVVGYESGEDYHADKKSSEPKSKEVYNSHEFAFKSLEKEKDDAIEYCYRVIDQQELVRAGYKVLSNVSLNECRCACAESWLATQELTCHSIQYNPTKSVCTLNKADHHGKYDLVFNRNTVYYHTSCTRQVFLTTVNSICNFHLEGTSESNSFTTTIAPIKKKKVKKVKLTTTTALPEVVSSQSTTTTEPTIQTTTTQIPTTTSQIPTTTEIPATTEIPTTTEPTTVPTTIPLATTLSTTTKQVKQKTPINPKAFQCFEVIPDYHMISVAGGLEHNVTLEECKCFCATGKVSGRYSFQCLSATYYHDAQDCVLNLADRHLQNSKYVKSNMKSLEISYIGMTCPLGIVSGAFGDFESHKCQLPETRKTPQQLVVEKKAAEEKRLETAKGKKTDQCFLELTSYVLEGNAMAIETDVSIEECKCYCIDAETRYGNICQSMQFYYDSNTCLLNKENRLSNPSNFNFNEVAETTHSYFDFTCHAEVTKLSMYVERVCKEYVDIKAPNQTVNLKAEDGRKVAGDLSLDSGLGYNDMNKGEKDFVEEEKKVVITSTSTTTTTAEPPITAIEKLIKPKKNVYKDEKKYIVKSTTTTTVEPTTVNNDEESGETTNAPTIVKATTLKPSTNNYEEESEESTDSQTTTELPSTRLTFKPSTTEFETTTVEPEETTTLPADIGPCQYSALYNRIFYGSKLIKRVSVTSPNQCFIHCHVNKCRSANLIVNEDATKTCELFRDSLVDYRRTDVIEYTHGGVHFDSIKCKHGPPKEEFY